MRFNERHNTAVRECALVFHLIPGDYPRQFTNINTSVLLKVEFDEFSGFSDDESLVGVGEDNFKGFFRELPIV